MRYPRPLRFLLLALARLAYPANGRQALLHISHRDSLELMVFSNGSSRALSPD